MVRRFFSSERVIELKVGGRYGTITGASTKNALPSEAHVWQTGDCYSVGCARHGMNVEAGDNLDAHEVFARRASRRVAAQPICDAECLQAACD